MEDSVVKISDLSKEFVLPHQRVSTIKSKAVGLFKKYDNEKQLAINKVSFEIMKGDFFGIVGRNGSGKSTLLKCIAGIYEPSQGSVAVNGRLVPFIELGVGFNPELSGRDNVYLNGALLGFSNKEMASMYKDIVKFAELEEFMDQKLKNYSSGMQVRLAFSIAIRAEGDILLLDEVLAVGDAIFQQKCYQYFYELKKAGRTVLFVSHDVNALSQYCTKGILLENGKVVKRGQIDDVLNLYTDIISQRETKNIDSRITKTSIDDRRHGTGKILVTGIEVLSAAGNHKKVFGDDDREILIQVQYTAKIDADSPVYGFVVKNGSGAKILASNNLWTSQKSKNLQKGKRTKVLWVIPNIFNTGEYSISPAVADTFGKETYDWVDDMQKFRVRKTTSNSALVNPRVRLTFQKG